VPTWDQCSLILRALEINSVTFEWRCNLISVDGDYESSIVFEVGDLGTIDGTDRKLDYSAEDDIRRISFYDLPGRCFT